MVGEKNGTFICTIFIENMRKIDPHKTITDIIMFDGASNINIGGELLKLIIQKFQLCVELNALYIYV